MSVFARLQLYSLLALILYLGVVRISPEVNDNVNDLVAHFVAYLALMVSGFFAFPHRRVTVKLFAAFLAFSIAIECIQFFLPYRSFSFLDMIANGLGLLAGSGISLILLPVFKRIHNIGVNKE